MPGPNLTGATATVEGLMDDDLRVRRDPTGFDEGLLDETSGLIGGDEADSTVWTGRGIVTTQREGDGTVDVAAIAPEQADRTVYRVLLPLAAPELRAGDVVDVLASRRDAQLPGRRFRLVDPGAVGTYVVARILTAVEL